MMDLANTFLWSMVNRVHNEALKQGTCHFKMHQMKGTVRFTITLTSSNEAVDMFLPDGVLDPEYVQKLEGSFLALIRYMDLLSLEDIKDHMCARFDELETEQKGKHK